MPEPCPERSVPGAYQEGPDEKLKALQTELDQAIKEIKETYPTARCRVVVESLTDPDSRIEAGDPNEEIFLGSLSKLCWMIAAIRIAEAEYSQGALGTQIPIPLTHDRVAQLYELLVSDDGDKTEVDALNSRLVGPRISKELFEQMRPLWTLEAARREADEEESMLLTGQMEELIELEYADVLGSFGLAELVAVTMGPSSNESVYVVREWIQNLAGGENPADYVQANMDEILESAGFDEDELSFSITGSTIHEDRSAKNTGTLAEVMTLYKMLATSDERLGISEAAKELFRTAMREVYDPAIDIQANVAETGVDVWGKIGWFPDGDNAGWLTELAEQNGWKSIATHHLSNVLCVDGKWLIGFTYAREIEEETERERSEQEQMKNVRPDINEVVTALIKWLGSVSTA